MLWAWLLDLHLFRMNIQMGLILHPHPDLLQIRLGPFPPWTLMSGRPCLLTAILRGARMLNGSLMVPLILVRREQDSPLEPIFIDELWARCAIVFRTAEVRSIFLKFI